MAEPFTSFFKSVLPEIAPETIQSFGAGGQVYSAEIWGGFPIHSDTENQLFTFSRDDNGQPFAKFLTNLQRPGQLGSTEEFIVTHVGARIVKFDGSAALSSAEVEAAKNCLASAYIELGLGNDFVKIGQFSGMHWQAPVDASVTDVSTVTAAVSEGGACANNFISLRVPIPMQRNVELRGSVKFAKAPDSKLQPAGTPAVDKFGFVVLLYGVKVIST